MLLPITLSLLWLQKHFLKNLGLVDENADKISELWNRISNVFFEKFSHFQKNHKPEVRFVNQSYWFFYNMIATLIDLYNCLLFCLAPIDWSLQFDYLQVKCTLFPSKTWNPYNSKSVAQQIIFSVRYLLCVTFLTTFQLEIIWVVRSFCFLAFLYESGGTILVVMCAIFLSLF